MNTKITKTEKVNYVLALLLGISLVSLLLFFNYISLQAKSLINKRVEYRQGMLKSRPLKQVEEDLGLVQNSSKVLKELYVDSNNVVDFISYIEDLARKASTTIEIKTITTGEVKIDEEVFNDLQNLSISIELSGSWKNVNKYIEIVENLPYHINIEELRLEKKSKDSDSIYGVSLKIEVVAK